MRCGGVASMSFFFAMSRAMPTTRNSSGTVPVFSNAFVSPTRSGIASPALIGADSAPTVAVPSPLMT